MVDLDKKQVAKMIDHTNLKPTAVKHDIVVLCDQAIKHGFGAVCINPVYVSLARELLKDSEVDICTVIGFPLGANTSEVKAFEAKKAIENGAKEIDMVINIGAVKSGDFDVISSDIQAVRDVTEDKTLKVILETCYLSDEEIKLACKAAMRSGANFVKTSTGFGDGGAKEEHIKIMKSIVGEELGIKASGGIRSGKDLKKMVEAGATRIGASSGVEILDDF